MSYRAFVKAALVLLAAAWLQNASACSCVRQSVIGFIHDDVTVLPANATGVLFHSFSDDAPDPARFTMVAATRAAPVKLRIDPVRLPDGHPMLAHIPRYGNLMRVVPVDGFRPGEHYTISHRSITGDRGSQRPSMSFTIDAQRFEPAAGDFSVALDGPARTTVLPLETGGGSCSEPRAVQVQHFSVRVPAALQRYLPALSMPSEARDVEGDKTFSPVLYRDSLCSPPRFGRDTTGLGLGRDLLHRSCTTAAAKVEIRSWVGMLEVDERFIEAAPATADLAAAQPGGCPGYAMLRQALERGDSSEATHLACTLATERSMRLGSLDTSGEDAPTSAQWMALAHQGAPKLAMCAHGALDAMVLLSSSLTQELRDTYLKLSAEVLRSAEPAQVMEVLNRLAQTQRLLRRMARDFPTGWQPDMLLPLMPQLLALAERDDDLGGAALRVLDNIGRPAQASVPTLMRLGDREKPVVAAVSTLGSIAPDDPAVHEALLRWAARPALRETAALTFARIAGARRPQEAVRLLAPLAQDGNVFAVDALANLGTPAQAATPILLELAQRTDAYLQQRTVAALMAIGPDQPEVVAALVRAAAQPDMLPMLAFDPGKLVRFRNHASGFAPLMDKLIDGAHTEQARQGLRELTGLLRVDQAERARLLRRLTACE